MGKGGGGGKGLDRCVEFDYHATDEVGACAG